ncbi:hypothetical protein Esti_001166 [Eimeria stiedai]
MDEEYDVSSLGHQAQSSGAPAAAATGVHAQQQQQQQLQLPPHAASAVVVCGTGLKECILSGLLSSAGKKVLHVDRNNYYGGDSASLNLTNLYSKFKPGVSPPASYGSNRDWNVDLIPKFVMACGKLVKILLKTRVTRYLEWQVVEGTFVYQYQKAGLFANEKFIHKVPANETEALMSPLMPLLEKNRCRSFFAYCAQWDKSKPETWKGFDPQRHSMEQVYKYFGLEPNTIDFVGHAVALYTCDDYLKQPMEETMARIKLYMYSVSRYGRSPFIYPVYGLGGLPEGFSRLCAVNGGTYMLNCPVDGFEMNEEGKVVGVKSKDGQVARCKMVVCDPSYIAEQFPSRLRKIGQVVRCICILGAPVPSTGGSSSCQIIIPQRQLKRQNDIYVMVVSSPHGICLKGKTIAIVSTTVETDDPEAELAPALKLLGNIEEKFVAVSDLLECTDNGRDSNIFVSSSFDATSHFESATQDVLKMWENMTGEPLDLSVKADPEDLQEQ